MANGANPSDPTRLASARRLNLGSRIPDSVLCSDVLGVSGNLSRFSLMLKNVSRFSLALKNISRFSVVLKSVNRLMSAADVSQRSAHSAGLLQISLLAATPSVLAHADADKTIMLV